jgi:hypothetical protein
MKSPGRQLYIRNITLTQALKHGIFLSLFLFSMFVAGCGSNNNTDTATNMTSPAATVTIDIGNLQKLSPTPTEPPLWCGAWATQTSPTYSNSNNNNGNNGNNNNGNNNNGNNGNNNNGNNGNTNIGVYGKFTQNVNGNPVGIDQADAVATVLWPDGSTESHTDMTTADGLATFNISLNNKAFAIDKLTLVTISFSKPGIGNCTVDTSRAAFFTIMPINKKKQGNNNNGNNGNNNGGNNNGNNNGGNNNGNNNNGN